jgi:copper chaperone CopZ
VRPGLLLFALLALLSSGCGAPSKTGARDLPPVVLVASASDEVTVNVLELICQTCYEHIISGCRHIEGVVSVEADRSEKLLTLHFDSSVTTRARVLAAVDEVVATI